MNTWEKNVAGTDTDIFTREPDHPGGPQNTTGTYAREARRPFDVGAGLRRIAADAGYVPVPSLRTPPRFTARRRLAVMARMTVTHAGAAAHVEELTSLLGDDDTVAQFDGWTEGVDIEGVQVFACMLYLAHHPESARFWWRFAAGAGSSSAAYCLYLDHLALGDDREAGFWKRQVTALARPADPGLSAEELLETVEHITGYFARHGTRQAVSTGSLEAHFGVVADLRTHESDGLVCRPDLALTDRIHELADRP
ncbi:hypothetical protein [Streptomyces filamentosus]|uniref:hypothetical protein n=1 Tax=Streptomyces filamentosus TaxID=67294 RepID=UPI0033222F82